MSVQYFEYNLNNWKKKRLKFLAKIQKGKVPKDIRISDDNTYPPYLSMDYLRSGSKCQRVYDKSKLNFVDAGEILLLWDGSNAGEFIKSRMGILSSTVSHLKFKKEINQDFAYYQCKFIEIILKQITIGMGIPHVDGQQLGNLLFFIPNEIEQARIATFLDKKTAEIDTAIAKKQRLIDLLKEQKAILINQAVTKGLNPDVPMKESGVEWIGEVPESWEIKRVKHVARLSPSKSSDLVNKNNELSTFLSMENIGVDGTINCSQKLQVCDLFDGFTYFKKNDVVIAKITPCFENGKGAFLSNLDTKFGFGTTELHVLRPKLISGNFLFLLLNRKAFLLLGEKFMTGSAGQKRIPSWFISNFLFAMPTEKEQGEIVKYCKDISSKVNEIEINEAESIQKLKEYKQTLIAHAVTGKIKV